MLQKDLNEENKEITKKAYELYEKHGFKDGNDILNGSLWKSKSENKLF